MAWLRSVLFGDTDAKVARKALMVERQAAELAGVAYRQPVTDGAVDDDPVGRLERAILVQRQALDRMHQTSSEDGRLSPEPDDRPPPPEIDQVAAAQRAIKLRDRILPLTDREGQDAKVLGWIDQELLGLLRDLAVLVIADEGEVDPQRHDVVDVRPATSDSQVDHIATTVRVGYLTGERLIRPQQVVAYVATEEASGGQ